MVYLCAKGMCIRRETLGSLFQAKKEADLPRHCDADLANVLLNALINTTQDNKMQVFNPTYIQQQQQQQPRLNVIAGRLARGRGHSKAYSSRLLRGSKNRRQTPGACLYWTGP